MAPVIRWLCVSNMLSVYSQIQVFNIGILKTNFDFSIYMCKTVYAQDAERIQEYKNTVLTVSTYFDNIITFSAILERFPHKPLRIMPPNIFFPCIVISEATALVAA